MAMGPRARTTLSVTLTVAVLGAGIWGVQQYVSSSEAFVVPACTADVNGGHTLDPEQTANAATIAAVAQDLRMPARAVTIALATAVQESKLRNVDYGDSAGPDSRGLFQQRPSQGWGTQAQVMDPVYAARAFYTRLDEFDYASMSVTAAAQKVQRSAYPRAYADHEPEGRAFASALSGETPRALTCTLRRATAAGDAAEVKKAMRREFGPDSLRIKAEGTTVWVAAEGSARLPRSVAAWAVANAAQRQVVSVGNGGWTWKRSDGKWTADASAPGEREIRIELAAGPESG